MRASHRKVSPKDCVPADDNPQRMDPDTFAALTAAIGADVETIDEPAVWKDPEGRLRIISGHHRIRAAMELGWDKISVKVFDDPACSELWYRKRVLSVNRTHGDPQDEAVRQFLKNTEALAIRADLPDFELADFMSDSGYSPAELEAFLSEPGDGGGRASLAERFLVPPFSVLDARQGYWKTRKQAWLALGLQSEVGRGVNLLKRSLHDRVHGLLKGRAAGERSAYQGTKDFIDAARAKGMSDDEILAAAGGAAPGSAIAVRDHEKVLALGRQDPETAGAWAQTGSSIFDPVLCELIYSWFSARGAKVLDPFAGGSVRGVVAAKLERSYLGIDLRHEQVLANEMQARELLADDGDDPTWLWGDSRKILRSAEADSVDLVFSCPPYADLEVYSEAEGDLSNMSWPDFCVAYREIIAEAARCLRPNRFAVWVVGEVRDMEARGGPYRGLVPETVAAFAAAGLQLYNEAILVTALATLPLRAAKAFEATRKLGKTHQNVLVFCKGDPVAAARACGSVDVFIPEALETPTFEGGEISPDDFDAMLARKPGAETAAG